MNKNRVFPNLLSRTYTHSGEYLLVEYLLKCQNQAWAFKQGRLVSSPQYEPWSQIVCDTHSWISLTFSKYSYNTLLITPGNGMTIHTHTHTKRGRPLALTCHLTVLIKQKMSTEVLSFPSLSSPIYEYYCFLLGFFLDKSR